MLFILGFKIFFGMFFEICWGGFILENHTLFLLIIALAYVQWKVFQQWCTEYTNSSVLRSSTPVK